MSHSTTPPSYELIRTLESKLETAHALIPCPLRIRPFADFAAQPPERILWSLNLELLYLKTKIVLHRPFMNFNTDNPDRLHSRDECIKAAVKTLKIYHQLHDANNQGVQPQVTRHYFGSIMTGDFLSAAMILCLELSHQCESAERDEHVGRTEISHSREELVELLTITNEIWARNSDSAQQSMLGAHQASGFRSTQFTDETKKASHALDITLARVRAMTLPNVADEVSSRSSAPAITTMMPTTTSENAKTTTPITTTPSAMPIDSFFAPFQLTGYGNTYATEAWDGIATQVPHSAQLESGVPYDPNFIDDMLGAPGDLNWGMWSQDSHNLPQMPMSQWDFDPSIMPDPPIPPYSDQEF